MLDKAIHIAARMHEGQKDKGGHPYILHPLRVMNEVEGETAKICAVLHDVVEDTGITFDDLSKEGFSEDVIEVLDALTKRENEEYDDFISRVLENKTACIVKLADLKDNLDLNRLPSVTEEDFRRMEKYEAAEKRILDILADSGQADK
ncbi:MAG TPA: HD domain-containing protein [Clostridia bacterium]|nr:HD domain-containing protein [Clostridia bacterium]